MPSVHDYTEAEWARSAKRRGITIEEAKRRFQLKHSEPEGPEPRGVPYGVRAAVGPDSYKAEDRLANLQQFYPTAQPYGEGNFVIQGSEGPYLYNPPGLDLGDIAEIGPRGFAEGLGGTVGTAVGLLGGPASSVAVPFTAGAGAELGGTLYDIGSGLFGRQDTRTPMERLPQQAITVGTEALGQRYAGDIQKWIKDIPRYTQRGFSRLAGRPTRAVAEDLHQAGVSQAGALAATTGDRPVAGMLDSLSNLPTSARTIGRALRQTYDDIMAYHRRIVSSYGPAGTTKEAVGDAVVEGATGAGRRFATRERELMGRVREVVPDDTPVIVDNVAEVYLDLVRRHLENPNSTGYLQRSIREARGILLDAGFVAANDDDPYTLVYEGARQMSFDALRSARTNMGKVLETPSAATSYVGLEGQAARRVYRAMRRDLYDTAESVSEEGAHRLRVHDRYVRRFKGIEEPLLDKAAKQEVDRAYTWALSGAKGGGKRLRAMRRNMTREEWDEVSSGVLLQMGQPTPGRAGAGAEEFSVGSFLTKWNNLSPEAKRALFQGGRYNELYPALERLVRISGAFKEAESMTNVSRTAQSNWWMKLFSGEVGALAVTAGVAAGLGPGATAAIAFPFVAPWATAKLITNPRFVNWLTRAITVSPTNYASMAAQLGRLPGIVTSPEMVPAVEEFVRAVGAAYMPQQGEQNGR